MSYFLVDGGRRLRGTITVQGAKNSVLPILAATLLVKGQSVIHNCPRLQDVDCTVRILRRLGCTVTVDGTTITVDATQVTATDIPEALMREMRSSIVFLGAILARCGQAEMSTPGGCKLGLRPIDLHLSALRQMGTQLSEGGTLVCRAPKLTGCDISLTFPSVGATENIMLAACYAEGVTNIFNAACEPEIVDLASFLCTLGVRVTGAGTANITISGRPTVTKATHTIIPDRIVAATYMAAVATAGGDVWLEQVDGAAVGAVIPVLTQAGCTINVQPNRLHIASDGQLKATSMVKTMPYPGFPTDAQAPIMAALTRAQGTTVFVETIFENRYRHVGELIRMGAQIRVEDRVAVITGVPTLYGANVESTDLRGGAALVVAALGASGTTKISGLSHIDRGYDGLETALATLGASIQRIE